MQLLHRDPLFSLDQSFMTLFWLWGEPLADWFFVVLKKQAVEQLHDAFLKADAIAPFCESGDDALLRIGFHENADC